MNKIVIEKTDNIGNCCKCKKIKPETENWDRTITFKEFSYSFVLCSQDFEKLEEKIAQTLEETIDIFIMGFIEHKIDPNDLK